MYTAIGVIVFAAGCATVGYLYWDLRSKRIVNRSLSAFFVEEPSPGALEAPASKPRRFARRHYVLPWLAAFVLVLLGQQLLHLPWLFAAAFGILIGLLLGQLDAMLLARTTRRIEVQLADAIDLMISALRVGASLQSALENAMRECHAPLRPQLDEVVGRIRLGDDPRSAVAGLAQRVPLETFFLFATALSVHWDVGGSLSDILATVGRTIRDRIEISQRLQAMTMQAQASVVAVLITTYFIAALMWRSDPGRMSHFLSADVGQWLASVSIALEGVGIVWISHLRNVRY